jgi:hypothetical protein
MRQCRLIVLLDRSLEKSKCWFYAGSFLKALGMLKNSVLLCGVFFSLTGLPFASQAGIHKCVGADGKVVFSDQACKEGQVATPIKAPVKATNQQAKAAGDQSKETTTDKMGPNLELYDRFCAEDQRLFDRDAGKLGAEDFKLRKARLEKRCNPQAREAAIQEDKESLIAECKARADELRGIKSLPRRPSGYADPDRRQEISISEAWLKANCN